MVLVLSWSGNAFASGDSGETSDGFLPFGRTDFSKLHGGHCGTCEVQ